MKSKEKKKKLIRNIIIAILLLILTVAGYVTYMILSYSRIPDRQYLDIQTVGDYSKLSEAPALDTSSYYEIMTYNIGFGAYTPEYDFFADGGKGSWALSEESVMADICEISNVINYSAPDFVFLQEVDVDGTRSYHVDELTLLNQFLYGYYYDFATNYDSKFICYPLYQPHGKNRSGIATYSCINISEAVRRQLPVTDGRISRLWDLDRCYTLSKVPLDNGKSLCLYNVHLSAYGSDASVRQAQLELLFNDMKNEYKMGNYIICGGDFNHNLRGGDDTDVPGWAAPFPMEMIPTGFYLPLQRILDSPNVAHDTCRNADQPYDEETSFTVTVDGFIVSENIIVNYYTNADWGYAYSDHDPVLMQIMFR